MYRQVKGSAADVLARVGGGPTPAPLADAPTPAASADKIALLKPTPPRPAAAHDSNTQSQPGEYETMDGISKLKTQLKVR